MAQDVFVIHIKKRRYHSVTEAARITGMSPSKIKKICRMEEVPGEFNRMIPLDEIEKIVNPHWKPQEEED